MTALSAKQQAQFENRDDEGRFQHKQHGDVDDTADVLGLDEDQDEQPQPVRYSFMAEFEKAEEQFNTDFDGVPNRFFNADLRGKVLGRSTDRDLDELADALGADPAGFASQRFDQRGLAGRLCHSVSAPDENRRMTDEQAEELMGQLGHVTEIRRIDDDEALLNTASKDATRGWLAKMEDTNPRGDRIQRWLLVTDGSHNKMRTFTLGRSRGDIGAHQQVTQTDLRSLAGAERIERRTGVNLIDINAMNPHFTQSTGDFVDDFPDGYSHQAFQQKVRQILAEEGLTASDLHAERKSYTTEQFASAQVRTVEALAEMEDAQLEGRNFQAQKKHLQRTSRSSAGVFDDKKHPDKAHQAMMAQTSLAASNGGTFSKVEIDNDVDPAEYADFEKAVAEVESKLPAIPAGRNPELRIRKLGRHNARGLFSPHRNAVAVDVRTSEAYIHEMGHYYDHVVGQSASLQQDFRSISRDYAAALKEPDSKRRQYLNTPTEQLARGFEVYAVERLGINNRLVRPEKFDDPDYAPFTQNPELKQRIFAFFDRTFS